MKEQPKDRITITLSPNVHKKVRALQASEIVKSDMSVSFSRVIEALVEIGLRNKEDIDLG